MPNSARRAARSNNITSALVVSAATVALLAILALLGPAAEAAFLPVLTDVTYRVVRRNDERMTLDWWGNKRRESCVLVSVTALTQRGPHMVIADLSRADDATDDPLPMATRPPGAQQLRRMDVIPSGTAIALLLRHNCHPLWQSVTHIPRTGLP